MSSDAVRNRPQAHVAPINASARTIQRLGAQTTIDCWGQRQPVARLRRARHQHGLAVDRCPPTLSHRLRGRHSPRPCRPASHPNNMHRARAGGQPTKESSSSGDIIEGEDDRRPAPVQVVQRRQRRSAHVSVACPRAGRADGHAPGADRHHHLDPVRVAQWPRSWRCCRRSMVAARPPMYSVFGFEVTPPTVRCALTILGYSLYDTIVRVRPRAQENEQTGMAAGLCHHQPGERVGQQAARRR